MLKTLLAAIGLTFAGAMASTAASAGPATINASPAVHMAEASASLLTPVRRWSFYDNRYRRDRDRRYYDRYADYRYRHRYRRPPAHWRGYSYRPYGWQNRGCIAVGPVWYCP